MVLWKARIWSWEKLLLLQFLALNQIDPNKVSRHRDVHGPIPSTPRGEWTHCPKYLETLRLSELKPSVYHWPRNLTGTWFSKLIWTSLLYFQGSGTQVSLILCGIPDKVVPTKTSIASTKSVNFFREQFKFSFSFKLFYVNMYGVSFRLKVFIIESVIHIVRSFPNRRSPLSSYVQMLWFLCFLFI